MAKMQEAIEVDDNTQCKFSLNNFKMVFVVNSDSYMYKKQALKRAKQVSTVMLCFSSSFEELIPICFFRIFDTL